MNDGQRLALLNEAVKELKLTKEGYPDKLKPGTHWARAMNDLKYLAADLKPTPVPQLGKVLPNGKTVLMECCTHFTDVLNWPAYDEKGTPGTQVLAPENLVVYDNTSSAQGGDAFYARGKSGIRYWFGHISTVPRLGAEFKKGQPMTKISREHPVPHVHVALDVRPLIGRHLISHHDYSQGAPLIGVQLKAGIN
jgi:hypothetical protein